MWCSHRVTWYSLCEVLNEETVRKRCGSERDADFGFCYEWDNLSMCCCFREPNWVNPSLLSIQLPHGKWCRQFQTTLHSLCELLQVKSFLSQRCRVTTTALHSFNPLSLFSFLFSLLFYSFTWKAKHCGVGLASVGLLFPDPDCKNDWRQALSLSLLSLSGYWLIGWK